MPTYLIEREIPGADKLTPAELKEIAATSNQVAAGLGEPYEWVTSYVAGDKVYCVHAAASAEVIERHSRLAGFPANRVTEIATVIGPRTADGA